MTTNNDLDALFSDAELPFGHPGRRFDDTPELSEHSPLLDQGLQPDHTPHEDTGAVHYAPGDLPLCENYSSPAVYTGDPHQVAACTDCLKLVAEDLQDHNDYHGHCLDCRREITAQGGVGWRRIVRNPCPHCGRPRW